MSLHQGEVWTEHAAIEPGAGLDGLGVRISGSGDPVFLKPGEKIRSRRPQSTVSNLIVLVALSAVAIEAGLVGWRSATYLKRANDHALYLNSARAFCFDSTAFYRWNKEMKIKYEYAASRPWMVVEPDPPQPEY